MALRRFILIALSICASRSVNADELLYRYEGDVHLLDPSTGFFVGFQPCDDPCSESVVDDRFRLFWPTPGGGLVNYHSDIDPLEEVDSLFWAEWRFRSNAPFNDPFGACDGSFSVRYRGIGAPLYMYGDAVVTFGGDEVLVGLPLESFHTYRFETLDREHYFFAVNGVRFRVKRSIPTSDFSSGRVGGRGGCAGYTFPNKYNEWDYVRYGRLETGEKIIAAEPPPGFHDPSYFTDRDRFAVTFDAPNYVYVDDIIVEVTGGVAPQVIATRRRGQDGPESLEIILDQPPPPHHTTRFIFDDGEVQNVVRYTLQFGDTNGDGLIDMKDAAALQNCFGVPQNPFSGTPPELIALCAALEMTGDGVVGDEDAAYFLNVLFAGPLP